MNDVYPEWWDTTITIYNKFEDPQTHIVLWYRTVVHDAFWQYVGEKITVGRTVIETDTTICRIKKDNKFLEHHEWIRVPNDKMSDYFTLGIGDIIVKGEVDDTIDEYGTNGIRSTALLSKYKKLQGCIKVEQVAINVGRGRGLEHYKAEGV